MCGTAYSFDRYGQFKNACLRWDCMQVLFYFFFHGGYAMLPCYALIWTRVFVGVIRVLVRFVFPEWIRKPAKLLKEQLMG